MTEGEVAAYACCSVGIGRWYWVAWASESDARGLAPALASGYEKSADAAERKAIESVGPRSKRLPAKWATGYKRRGGLAARAEEARTKDSPKGRLSRPAGFSRRASGPSRLTFLYFAFESDQIASRGEVVVVKHRIVRQSPEDLRRPPALRRGRGGPPGGRGGAGGRPEGSNTGRRSRYAEARGAVPPSRVILLCQRGGRHPGHPCGPDVPACLVLRARREVPLLGGIRQVRLPTARPGDPPGRRWGPDRVPGGGAGLSRGPRLLRTRRQRHSPVQAEMIGEYPGEWKARGRDERDPRDGSRTVRAYLSRDASARQALPRRAWTPRVPATRTQPFAECLAPRGKSEGTWLVRASNNTPRKTLFSAEIEHPKGVKFHALSGRRWKFHPRTSSTGPGRWTGGNKFGRWTSSRDGSGPRSISRGPGRHWGWGARSATTPPSATPSGRSVGSSTRSCTTTTSGGGSGGTIETPRGSPPGLGCHGLSSTRAPAARPGRHGLKTTRGTRITTQILSFQELTSKSGGDQRGVSNYPSEIAMLKEVGLEVKSVIYELIIDTRNDMNTAIPVRRSSRPAMPSNSPRWRSRHWPRRPTSGRPSPSD